MSDHFFPFVGQCYECEHVYRFVQHSHNQNIEEFHLPRVHCLFRVTSPNHPKPWPLWFVGRLVKNTNNQALPSEFLI